VVKDILRFIQLMNHRFTLTMQPVDEALATTVASLQVKELHVRVPFLKKGQSGTLANDSAVEGGQP
jgi:RNase H-fold protein (predicted Holliday junction resolvase)